MEDNLLRSIHMTTKTLPDQVTDAAFQIKDKVNDLSRSASEKIDAARAAAAAGLNETASALHNGGETVADLAHDAADKLSSSAKYLRCNDVPGIFSDLRGIVKKNPGMSLLVAGFVGFAMARALTSHD
jgi:ABC-type transporter Mla subunit MlaD